MMKLTFTIATLLSTLAFSAWSAAQDVVVTIDSQQEKPQKAPFEGVRPAADVAILLDTSNSMDGLISQAKSQLWNIVQQFSKAKKNGQTPLLRVAVFEYGNTNLPATEGYIRQVVGLTDDLDDVSAALFGLTTRGGDEYCGQVIDEAINRLAWSDEPNAYKAIFIAGNEPFTQGPVDYKSACSKSIQSGVIVNTIHCGEYQAGISGKWQHGAQLAEGEYMNINQDRQVVAIKTPYDKILIELNDKLNNTYLWYGDRNLRLRFKSNQLEQDRNAFNQSGAGGLGGRAAVKGGSLYSKRGQDLVDTFKVDKSILSKVAADQLPEQLQSLDAEQRAEFLEKTTRTRAEIQKQIAEVNQQRLDFIADEKRKRSTDDQAGSTLGDAIESAVTSQMKKSGFEFKR